jgi:hypothetical protein
VAKEHRNLCGGESQASLSIFVSRSHGIWRNMIGLKVRVRDGDWVRFHDCVTWTHNPSLSFIVISIHYSVHYMT